MINISFVVSKVTAKRNSTIRKSSSKDIYSELNETSFERSEKENEMTLLTLSHVRH